jgi:hypothetical protein
MKQDVDARVKPAHGGFVCGLPAACARRRRYALGNVSIARRL